MALSLLTGIGHDILLVVAYALIGSGMKYVDQAFDLGIFSKKAGILMSIPGAILMGLLMAINDSSATIFLAIVLGLALTKKIDNIAFQIGLFFLIMVPIFFSEYVNVQWLPFTLLLMAGVADEYTSDWSDLKIKKRTYNEAVGLKKPKTPLKQRILEIIFQHRVVMKLMILLLALTGLFQWIYLIAFLAFDFSYKLVEIYSFHVKKFKINRNLKTNKKTIAV